MKLLVAVLLLLATGAGGGVEAERPQSSPRTFVPVGSCRDRADCPAGYWAFRAPDCEYRGASHAPGTAILLAGGATFQCRCDLMWLWTKAGEPPRAKVTCRWIDVQEARKDE